MLKIKAYIGVIGSGKDYRSSKECDRTVAFADKLRSDIWTMLGWEPKTDEEYQELKATEAMLPDGTIVNFRDVFFTGYGTEVRKKEDSKHWIKQVRKKLLAILSMQRGVVVGISDCRFSDEIKGLIEFSRTFSNQVTLTFHHCNYKSDRYNDRLDHESEYIAQALKDWSGTDEEFNELIFEEYGKK